MDGAADGTGDGGVDDWLPAVQAVGWIGWIGWTVEWAGWAGLAVGAVSSGIASTLGCEPELAGLLPAVGEAGASTLRAQLSALVIASACPDGVWLARAAVVLRPVSCGIGARLPVCGVAGGRFGGGA